MFRCAPISFRVATLTAIARLHPDEAKMAANPRARSAVMRVAERTAEPWPEATAMSASPGRPKTRDVPLGGTARSAREQQ